MRIDVPSSFVPGSAVAIAGLRKDRGERTVEG